MKKIFHYHITIEKCTSDELMAISKTLNAKPTTIDLYNDTLTQKDRMITKYGTNADDLKLVMLDDMLAIHNLGFSVIRMKIEENVKELTYSSLALLTEVHIKVDSNYTNHTILKLSENSADNVKFLNGRAYNLKELMLLDLAIKDIEYLSEPQYEIVWFDTNQLHDSWWA